MGNPHEGLREQENRTMEGKGQIDAMNQNRSVGYEHCQWENTPAENNFFSFHTDIPQRENSASDSEDDCLI